MSLLQFEPWIGENYNTSKEKILIIGDSHYWPYIGHKITYDKNFTKNIVSDSKSINAKFFKNLSKLFGKENFSEVRDNIAFANAVQEFMLNSNDKLTTQQLNSTAYSIQDYIKLTSPNKVIVLSFRIWQHLFNKKKNWGNYKQDITGANKKTTIWELYPSQETKCLAIGLYHPSYQHWKLDDWKPILDDFLNNY